MRRLVLALVGAGHVLLMSGCGGGGVDPDADRTYQAQGPNASTLSYRAISPAAARVQVALNADDLPPLPAGTQVASDFHRFTVPDAGVTHAEVRIALSAQAANDASARLLFLGHDGTWQSVEGTKQQDGFLVASIPHLAAVAAVVAVQDVERLANVDRPNVVATAIPIDTPTAAAANAVPAMQLRAGMVGETVVFTVAAETTNFEYFFGQQQPGVMPFSCVHPGGDTRQCVVNDLKLAQNNSVAVLQVAGSKNYEQILMWMGLLVYPAGPPVVSVSTAPVSVNVGQVATFVGDVANTSTGGTSYQWLRDGMPITGANRAVLTLNTVASDAGRVSKISLRATNKYGAATSAETTLTVSAPAGTISASEGGFIGGPSGTELYVPPGALKSNAPVKVTRQAVAADLLPAGFTAVSDIIKIEAPSALNKPLELLLPLPTLPAGHTVVFLKVPDSAGNALRQAASADNRLKPQALSSAGAMCSNPQNATQTDKLAFAITGSVNLVATVTEIKNCPAMEPRKLSTSAPSTTDQECQQDADFLTGSSEVTLLSRHVDCQLAVASGTTVDADYKRSKPTTPDGKPGPWTLMSTAKYDEATEEVRSVERLTGGRLETRISIYGPGNRLEKRVSLRMRLVGAKPDAGAAAQGFPDVTSVKARFKLVCTDPSVCTGTPAPVIATVPVNGSWSSPVGLTVPFADPGTGNQHSTRLDFSRVEYAAGPNAFETPYSGSASSGSRPWSARIETSPLLTCDNALAKAKTKGCVFEDAAAVFDIDQRGAAAKRHIVEAVNNPALPHLRNRGRFSPAPGLRAVASSDAGGVVLQRTRIAAIAKTNREVVKPLCAKDKSTIGDTPVDSDGDPIVPDEKADCDEYPPASTTQGGNRLGGAPSIKKISAAENRSAGSQLGNFYEKQRVKNDGMFWIKLD